MFLNKTRLMLMLVLRFLSPPFTPPLVSSLINDRHTKIIGCEDLITSSGRYIFQGTPTREHCLTMLVGKSDQFILANITNLSLNCRLGYLELQDGVEIMGGFFPTENGLATLDACSKNGVLVSESNVAQLLYQAGPQDAFILDVLFKHNPKPCHVLQQGLKGEMTISSFVDQQSPTNCTLLLAYPSHLQISLVRKGPEKKVMEAVKALQFRNSFGLFERLEALNEPCGGSFVEVLVGEHPSSKQMRRVKSICPSRMKTRSALLRPRMDEGKRISDLSINIRCSFSRVKVVMDGRHRVEATIKYTVLEEEDDEGGWNVFKSLNAAKKKEITVWC